jgi:hypothetical protein
MKLMPTIAVRMEKIRAIFQYAMSVTIHEEDINVVEQELSTIDNEFRSVAYEAAAMNIALKDISTNNKFRHWQSFMRLQGIKHLTQVHIGLGWAMAQQQFPVLPFIEILEPLMQCRMIDGYGYYEGAFRKRKALEEKKVPQEIPTKFLAAYDQGLGRSIWYICKADCEKLAELVSAFPYSRQKDLWRGIGTACVYVGGFDESLLRQLEAAASVHRIQLSIGASLVARTRTEADSHSIYTDMACRAWCECSEEMASEITTNTIPQVEANPDPCAVWLSNIKEAFLSVRTC